MGCVPKIATKGDIAETAESFSGTRKKQVCDCVRFMHIRAEFLNKCNMNTCGLNWLRIGSSGGLLLT